METIDYKTIEKLQKLKNLYVNNAAAQGEKDNAYKIMSKLCTKYSINTDDFIKNGFTGNKKQNTRQKTNQNKSAKDNFRDGFRNSSFYDEHDRGPESFWEGFESARRAQNNRKKTYDDSYDTYNYRKAYEEKLTGIYEIKGVIFEEVRTKGTYDIGYKVYTLSRQDLGRDRWGTQNFVYYPIGRFDPNEFFNKDTMDRIFRVKCTDKKYYGDHILIKEIYKVNPNGTETKIG